jgi:hypothetical protein
MPSGFIEAHVYPLRRVSSGSCNHLHIHLSSDIVARFGLIDRISRRRRTVSGSTGTRCPPLAGSPRMHSAAARS